MFEQIVAAKERLRGQANQTPVMTSRTLNRRIGAEVFLKCENFQRMGAFKFRGAYNTMSRLTGEEKSRGVITHSSGNHAQAVALVGRILDIRTTVVMPKNAPAIKRAATEEYGAAVIDYDPAETTREAVSRELVSRHGYTLVPPFDHEQIVAGQGTAAMELLEETGNLEALLVPCGGGGLLSGCAIAAKHMAPSCKVVGIEPVLGDDATRSFHSKTLHRVDNPPTIADGTRTSSLGEITFPLVLRHVDDMKTVTEEEIVDAVRFLFFRMKLVVEPSGALGVAALLGGAVVPKGPVGVIISGGNIDGAMMAEILKA